MSEKIEIRKTFIEEKVEAGFDVDVPIGHGLTMQLTIEPKGEVLFWGFGIEADEFGGGDSNVCHRDMGQRFPECGFTHWIRSQAGVA